jgi:hypothetical protein
VPGERDGVLARDRGGELGMLAHDVAPEQDLPAVAVERVEDREKEVEIDRAAAARRHRGGAAPCPSSKSSSRRR